MSLKAVGWSLLIFLVILALVYIFGFIDAFKNYGNQGNWKPLSEFKFNMKKSRAEQKIINLVLENQTSLWFADTSNRFTKEGWHTIFIKSDRDTIEYIYRFKGDDATSQMNDVSSIMLLIIGGDGYRITPTTISQTSYRELNRKINIFEDSIVNRINFEK